MFAVLGIVKTYKMLTSTIGGWLLSLELDFAERNVDLRKKLICWDWQADWFS